MDSYVYDSYVYELYSLEVPLLETYEKQFGFKFWIESNDYIEEMISKSKI